MSIGGLSNTTIKILSPVDSQDIYAAHQDQWYVKIGEFKCRVRLLKPNLETFIDGKEMSPTLYRFYPPKQLSVDEGDLIYDVEHNRYYDIKFVNLMDERKHLQIDALRIDDIISVITQLSSSSSSSSSGSSSSSMSSSSSSSNNQCPNYITAWVGTVMRVA